jgi:hypothetical protein
MPDALFGVDGTEMPNLRSDPSGRGGWRDAPELPPLTLPGAPDANALREAIAAAFREEPTVTTDEDNAAPPADQHNVTQPNVAPADTSQQHPVTTPLPTPPASPTAGLPTATSASGHRASQPLVPVPIQPVKPLQRGLGGRNYRPPLAAAARVPVRLIDLRRRVGPQGSGTRRQSRSGGAGVVLVIGLIIFAVLLYNIIAGIVEAIVRLIP